MLTPQDEVYARIITVLLCSAKCLQAMKAHAPSNSDNAALAAQLDGLMKSLVDVTHGDGDWLEREALALGRRLGFHVEQHYTHQGSGGVH